MTRTPSFGRSSFSSFSVFFSALHVHTFVHVLPRNHWPFRDQFQATLVAALATWLYLSRQPPPILSRQFRIQYQILGQGECLREWVSEWIGASDKVHIVLWAAFMIHRNRLNRVHKANGSKRHQQYELMYVVGRLVGLAVLMAVIVPRCMKLTNMSEWLVGDRIPSDHCVWCLVVLQTCVGPSTELKFHVVGVHILAVRWSLWLIPVSFHVH